MLRVTGKPVYGGRVHSTPTYRRLGPGARDSFFKPTLVAHQRSQLVDRQGPFPDVEFRVALESEPCPIKALGVRHQAARFLQQPILDLQLVVAGNRVGRHTDLEHNAADVRTDGECDAGSPVPLDGSRVQQ